MIKMPYLWLDMHVYACDNHPAHKEKRIWCSTQQRQRSEGARSAGIFFPRRPISNLSAANPASVSGTMISGARQWMIGAKGTRMSRPEHKHSTRMNPNTRTLPTGLTGAIGEVQVAAVLMSHGWCVLRQMTPAAPFDLAIYKDGIMFRLEVRSARRYYTGNLVFSNVKDEYKEHVDYVAVYSVDDNLIFWHDSDNQPVEPPWIRQMICGA